MTAPEQLRRRREASRRCEVLADGRGDPLDEPRSRAHIFVRILHSGTGEISTANRAVDRLVAETCTRLGVRYQRAPRTRGAWLVRSDGVRDVLDQLEGSGYAVEAVL